MSSGLAMKMQGAHGGGWKRYPAYRDSGVTWLGAVPEGWRVKRLKNCVKDLVGGGTPDTGNSAYWSADETGIAWVAIADMTKDDTIYSTKKRITREGLAAKQLKILPSSTLLYSMYASLGKVTVLGIPAVTNQAILGILLSEELITRDFLKRWFEHMERQVVQLASSNTQDNLNAGKVKNMPLFHPPLPEQHAIAAFLDRETAKIDALAAKKERLVKLLEEKRTALISHAVTKGLDPDAPMKDSSIEWLGAIPAHWGTKHLGFLTQQDRPIRYGIVLPGPNIEDGVPIIKGGDVAPGRLRLDLVSRTSYEIEAKYARSRLRGGDLVYAIRGSIGMVEVVPPAIEGANLTQDAARVAPRSDVHTVWLLYALKSGAVFAQLDAGAQGATIRGINIKDLKRAVLPIPPTSEQFTIAAFLDRETAKMDTLTKKIYEQIDKLKEYRTALISAAVTGKIDVRGEMP